MRGEKSFTCVKVKKNRQCGYVVIVRWRENGSLASMFWDRNTEEELAEFTGHYTPGGKEIANRTSKVDDYVKHVFREHNQEADHWANVGGEKTVVDKGNNTERWKAVQGFWDGQLHGQRKKRLSRYQRR